ncbi:translation initiation factor IF-2 [Faecalitalea cylindroides]|uniref:translation initiation factor IF-2 n=1 Tax=Faecalitalea cylindroides TaxID=39483 RepID=UPI0023307FE7|nr:translation initiation factor IF-2 [Faecalitalea cylindroides]MDB7952569.1 translation initiation factor IF-2 [Faecalitalea cylindroides]MDB7959225.1 translation initiation factor IF-2 [Faecalitalea cylindroides]MDB7961099.1 translation initiation factor IF-2 [Faecalitalea cylindroides]MDB7963154.1 translation initiation factor IF-2 [Faecalitalea cylindroides]MDB7965061.1 translation initiation factor IF-2 [Faecalitalea cylindroides]
MPNNNRPRRKPSKKGPNKYKNTNSAPRKVEAVKEITYSDSLTVGQLANLLHKNSSEIIKFLFMMGNMSTINTVLSDDDIELICMEFGVEVHKEVIIDEDDIEEQIGNIEEDDSKMVPRPPVVTIMGHVDHGKTTLLDTIRKTNVTSGEFGGITQHIGAYQVSLKGRKVTFLDTPGHEAFTAMRARGAQVTDIVIIVVAADDGVMPQTKEAVDHAKAAGVPIVVAVNKIDKPGANPDRIMSEMAELGIMPEEWGGDTIFMNVSAKQGTGVSDLLETVLLVADMAELKANPDQLASGTVIEAKLDKGRGPVATLLVQRGTLHSGDSIVVGTSYGRVRKMTNDKGMEIKKAEPSCPVEIIGLNDVPRAGDVFMAYDNYKKAQEIASHRLEKQIEKERNATSAMSLEDLAKKIDEGDVKEINVLIKADVQGSAEALKASMERLEVDTVRVNVIRSTVGTITESDILLASASNAIIYGFNIRPSAAIRKKAEEEGIEIRLHNIIYKALEELESAMKGMLAPVYEEVVIGQAEVRQIYKVSKVGTIAGCKVVDGHIKRDCKVRLIREGIVIYDGKLGSLRRFENDVKEVQNGFECGMTIENYNDIKVDDIIEAYEDQEV